MFRRCIFEDWPWLWCKEIWGMVQEELGKNTLGKNSPWSQLLKNGLCVLVYLYCVVDSCEAWWLATASQTLLLLPPPSHVYTVWTFIYLLFYFPCCPVQSQILINVAEDQFLVKSCPVMSGSGCVEVRLTMSWSLTTSQQVNCGLVASDSDCCENWSSCIADPYNGAS